VQVVTTLPPGWHAPNDRKGRVIPGPYAIPTDGQGWGRGLMQHDYHRALAFDWRDPAVNISKGAELLFELVDKEFPRNLRAAAAAYNCGPANVRKALLLRKDEDFFTTGQDYGADVLRRKASFLQEPTRGSA
jgi:soluble lytic murein transglycosylase-like protein